MKKSKLAKVLTVSLAALMVFGLASCGGGSGKVSDKDITVISREEGSGTRDAFTELTGVLQDDVDKTVDTAEISNSTSVVTQSVAGNDAAIGYISLGSLDDTVKAVKVDGVEATVDNIKSGDYKIQRPFNIVTKDNVSDVAQDFINYIMSADGQQVIADDGYISVAEGETFTSTGASGKITIDGSSSVSPVMEKLVEAYKKVNPNADIEQQTTDSTTGITSAIDGKCDIGMASRDLKEEETGVKATKIALDGIAVIVNNANPIDEISSDMVKQIFTGEVTQWDAVK